MRNTECLLVNTGVEVHAILRLFSRCVFRHLSWPGRRLLLENRQERLRRPFPEIHPEDILPRLVWTLPRYFNLRSLYSAPLLPFEKSLLCPLLPLEKSLLCPATSIWEVFTLPRYFHLRSLYSAPLLPLEESLLCPATSTWGVFTLTRYESLHCLATSTWGLLLCPATSTWGMFT